MGSNSAGKSLSYWSTINRGKRGKKADCCPAKTHYAKGMCKTCYYKSKWDNDPVWREKQRAMAQKRENSLESKKTRSAYREKLKDSAYYRDKRDATLYNLLPGERDILRQFQNNRDPITGHLLVTGANLDHDHKTGKVRGLLNPITNKFLVDNEQKLLAMLKYIQNPPAPLALGETVFGLIGQAKHKKKMIYGPHGTPNPQPRKSKP